MLLLSLSLALAGDGADSPASIDKANVLLVGKLPCAALLGEIRLGPSDCTITPTGATDPTGLSTSTFQGDFGSFRLEGTLTPDLEGATFVGMSTCSSTPTPYTGRLIRKDRMRWEGTLQPAPRSALCGPFQLLLGDGAKPKR